MKRLPSENGLLFSLRKLMINLARKKNAYRYEKSYVRTAIIHQESECFHCNISAEPPPKENTLPRIKLLFTSGTWYTQLHRHANHGSNVRLHTVYATPTPTADLSPATPSLINPFAGCTPVFGTNHLKLE